MQALISVFNVECTAIRPGDQSVECRSNLRADEMRERQRVDEEECGVAIGAVTIDAMPKQLLHHRRHSLHG